VTLLAKVSPGVVYYVETEQPVVALTIDDGPDPAVTPRILDVLQEYEAHATFFLLTSRLPGSGEILERMLEEGHEIANHLVYDDRSIALSDEEFESQLIESHALLAEYTDQRYFRPGSGWYSPDMLSTLDEQGYRCVLGSVYPFDPQLPSTWFATNYILLNTQPGSIIVMHDYGARGERTADALEVILPELDRLGYRVVTLSEMFEGTD
jgi:peptidoglycan/xylan/chitin deacetylase (PgdA/CDA1 family)